MSLFFITKDRIRQILAKKLRRFRHPRICVDRNSLEYRNAKKIFEIKAATLKTIIENAFTQITNPRFSLYPFTEFNFQSESYVRFLLYEDEFFPNLEFAINVEKDDFSDIFSFFKKFNEKCLDKNSFVPEIVDTAMNITNKELFDFVFNSEFQKYLVFSKESHLGYDEEAIIELFNHCSILEHFPSDFIKDEVATVPESVKIINNSAFLSDIKKIVIPKNVERIENYAFAYCNENVEIVCENPNLKLPNPLIS